MTTLATVYIFFGSIPIHWIIGMSSAAVAFLVVSLLTASLVLLKNRSRQVAAVVGRKGFLDYKIQGLRGLKRMNISTVAMTTQMQRIGKLVKSGTRRVQRAQRGWWSSEERAYRSIQRTAQGLRKLASVFGLHAESYISDVVLFREGVGKWMDWIVEKGGADNRQRSELASLLDGFQGSIEGTIPILREYRVAVENSRASSEALDIVGAMLTETIDRVIISQEETVLFCKQTALKLRG